MPITITNEQHKRLCLAMKMLQQADDFLTDVAKVSRDESIFHSVSDIHESFRIIEEIFEIACADCGHDSINSETGVGMYIVTDELWETYGEEMCMLCLACFEKRLGRSLRHEDFDSRYEELNSWALNHLTDPEPEN